MSFKDTFYDFSMTIGQHILLFAPNFHKKKKKRDEI